jgi:hypothetical protein
MQFIVRYCIMFWKDLPVHMIASCPGVTRIVKTWCDAASLKRPQYLETPVDPDKGVA